MKALSTEWKEALPHLSLCVPFDLERATVAVFRVGSHSHGTYVPPEDPDGIDDVDLMVIVVPPPEFVLGLKRFEHASFKHGNLDVVIYDWAKWLRMIAKSNPNVVGTLWLEEEDRLFPWAPMLSSFWESPMGDMFWHKKKFLSKRMYPAFVGYAQRQLHKMTHFAHQGYMGEKRKLLVEKYGYDVKNAAHLIRLMRMACEALEEEHLRVRRHHDAATLIEIKRGGWTKEQVVEEADRLFARATIAHINTSIPDEPDELLLQRIMVEGYRGWWKWKV